MERRNFLKNLGFTAAAVYVSPKISGNQDNPVFSDIQTGPSGKQASVTVKDNIVNIETYTLSATVDKGVLISLKSKINGEEFISNPDVTNSHALQLLYVKDDIIDINEKKYGSIETHQISDRKAEVIFHSWDGDGVLFISADPETGDLLMEPSAYSSRPGVLACRWIVSGLKPDLDMVAPLFQGVKLKMDDPLIKNNRWMWPSRWEAGLVIFQSGEGGFWIHTQDNNYRYKALQTGIGSDPFTIGLESEAYGPVDNNLSAGGLCWRINTYKGNWQVPVETYRQWYWQAYHMDAEEQNRQPWIHDVSLALSWCPGEPEILDALAKRVSPKKILLHFPNWRTDNYDENYPTYNASESGKAFIKKCQNMGFRIMPHFNTIDMDPNNPVYTQVRDFVYRDVQTKQIQGWSWVNQTPIGVPESNLIRLNNSDKKVMVKIHPGLARWRSILGENIRKPALDLGLETAFVDVAFNTWNLNNCLVESMTPTEGMNRLIEHIAGLGKGLVVGGEGLNEIIARKLSFGQAHTFNFMTSMDGLERLGGCNLNEVLLGRVCRAFGYNGLSGKTKESETRMQIFLEHGMIPTITIRSAEEITNPNPGVKRMIDIAAG